MEQDCFIKVMFAAYDISILDAAFLAAHVTLGGNTTKQHDHNV